MNGKLRQRLRLSVILCACLIGGWYLLPPLLGSTSLVTRYCENYIGAQLGGVVDINQMMITTLHGPVRVQMASCDLYSSDGQTFVAACHDVTMDIYIGAFLCGGDHVEITIRQIDSESPTTLFHDFLLSRGYLSRSLIATDEYEAENNVMFSDVRGAFVKDAGAWHISAHGVGESSFIHSLTCSVECVRSPGRDRWDIDHLDVKGIRHVSQRFISDGSFDVREYDTPLGMHAYGHVSTHGIYFPQIAFHYGSCTSMISVAYTNDLLHCRVDVHDQPVCDLTQFARTRTVGNILYMCNGHMYCAEDPDTGVLHTDVRLRAEQGRVNDIPFKYGTVTCTLENDKVTAFTSSADIWNGYARVSLLEQTGARPPGMSHATNSVLFGELRARRMDLHSCLSNYTYIPATTRGDLDFHLSFDVDNVSVSEFIMQNLREFDVIRGTGHATVSNAYLSFFGSEQWHSARDVPEIVKTYLGLAAEMSAVPRALPLLRKVIPSYDSSLPRAVTMHFELDHGTLTTPMLEASTPLGSLQAQGECSESGAMVYEVSLKLQEQLRDAYGSHPLLTLFTRGDEIILPVRVTGTLAKPRAELDLTPDQRQELEDRLWAVIREYVEKKLARERDGEIDEDMVQKDLKRLEKTVRNVLARLL